MSWISRSSRFGCEIDDFLDSLQRDLYSTTTTSFGNRAMRPAVNIYETDGEWAIYAEFPGVKKEDMTVKVTQKYITISAESKFSEQHTKDNLRYQEYHAGTYSRKLPLPNNIDYERIVAKFENGVLEVILPKDPSHTKYNRLINVD